MITTPSTSQLVRSVSSELRAKVLPELTDPALLVELEMMLSMLDMAAVRADHEIAWMLQEADGIDAALTEAAAAGELPGPRERSPCQAHRLEHLLRPRAPLLRGATPYQRRADVVQDAQGREQVELLEDEPDRRPVLGQLTPSERGDLDVPDGDAAFGGDGDGSHQVEQR